MASNAQIQSFIVRLDDKYFFQTFGVNGDDVRGTTILSEAAHQNYVESDILCQYLKAKNYGARVCDRYGRAVTASTLQLNDEPGLPTPEQLRLMDSTTLKRRYYSEPNFRKHVDAAIKKGLVKRTEDFPQQGQAQALPAEADWDILRSITAGEEPAAVAQRFGITVMQLLVRMEQASARFGALAEDIHKGNQDRRNLANIQKANQKVKV